MSKNPCHKEYIEFCKAMDEWLASHKLTAKFAVTKPLDPKKSPLRRVEVNLEGMREAFKQEELAKEKFIKATESLSACQEKKRVS